MVNIDKKFILACAQGVIEVVALFMLFGCFVEYRVFGDNYEFKGRHLIFGKNEDNGYEKVTFLKASAGGVMSFILMCVVLLVAIAKIFLEQFRKILNYVIIGCSFVAGIFIFCANTAFWFNFGPEFGKYKNYKDNMHMEYGTIIDGVINFVICILSAVDEFVFK